MTDRDPRDPADLSEDDVARLLGSLGDAEAMPDDVRGRLDDALAGLVSERAAEASPVGTDTAPVVPLRPERRRRTRRTILAAAAVLGVVGLGVGVAEGLLGDLTGGGSDAATAGDAAESAGAGTESGAGEADEQGGAAAEEGAGDSSQESQDSAPEAPDALSKAPEGATAARGVPEVGTDEALRSVVRAVAADRVAFREGRDALLDQRALAADQAGCVRPRVDGARLVAVTYRGAEATLVVRTVDDQVQGRVHSCSLGLVLDGVRIPSPPE